MESYITILKFIVNSYTLQLPDQPYQSLSVYVPQTSHEAVCQILWYIRSSLRPLKPNDRFSCQLLWNDLMREIDMDEGRIQCGRLKDIFIGLIPIHVYKYGMSDP